MRKSNVIHGGKAGILLLSVLLLGGCEVKGDVETEAETDILEETEAVNVSAIDGYGAYKWGTSEEEILKEIAKNVGVKKGSCVKTLYVENPQPAENKYSMYSTYQYDEGQLEGIKRNAEAFKRKAVLVTSYEADEVRLGLYKMPVKYVFEEGKLSAVVYKDEYTVDDSVLTWKESGLQEQYKLKYGAPALTITTVDNEMQEGMDIWRDDNKNVIFAIWSENRKPIIEYIAGGSLYYELFAESQLEDSDYAIEEYMEDGILNYGV